MQFPYTIEAADDGCDLEARLHADREEIRRRLRTHGAVLFRGFDVGGAENFENAIRALSGEPLSYEERSSPRSTIKGKIYTSTEYPPHEEIFFHNENSYRNSWPMTLYFYCIEAPAERGATPLADSRKVLASLDPAVREEFTRRRWMVVRNFGSDFGLPWQEVYNTEDRDEVVRYCEANGIQAEWRADDGLRTTSIRDAVHRHPWTHDEVWFNHAAIFHISTLSSDVQEGLREMFDEADLPNNTYFGDGGQIPDDVMEHVRSCYRASSTRFDYRPEDVLVLDNMLTAHGRESFQRPRRIAVGMAEPVSMASS